ncbi:MAG: ABC transporter permease [Candidatus Omnitrophota bacterium]|nr:ABC transporter permease [Candidatus Omnitrophota bacterium]MBU1928958.1 ABC transporter permease [Candidatus Omnitrophota bacterium]MBU2035378.1 ABC transporter permease [Candidatus Omnitrophota bacterium]MBU2258077.1 ABC transporter permease [Candidatus Omnitrophota bacterium]
MFKERIKKIYVSLPVIRSMVLRNQKDKYGGTGLGILWSVINPILIALVITFVFTFVMKASMRHYPLFILSGLLPWFFFVNSITESTNCMRQNLDVLGRFVMPKEVIPLSVTISNFLNFAAGFMIILPVFVLFKPDILLCLLLLPVLIFLFFVFTLGVSLGFSVLTLYCKDLSQLVSVGTMFIFWVTPIFYDLAAIPVKYHWMIYLNPVFSYAALYQSLLYEGHFGSIQLWLGAVFFSLIGLVGGYAFFLKKEDEIIKNT